MRGVRRACWLAVLLMAAQAQAAVPPLTGTLHMAAGSARTGAPLWVDLDATNNTASLLEGHLEIGLYDGPDLLAGYRGWDMALAPGQQRSRFLLPAPQGQPVRQLLDVQVSFMADPPYGRLDLGPQMLNVPAPTERSCVVALASPDAGSMGPPGLVRSLQLERYQQDRSPDTRRRLNTRPAVLAPEDFPVSALGYCAYDLVVLPADAFGLMRQSQLEALADWVGAGGSVCVLTGEGTLKAYQEEFLKTLSGGATPEGGTAMRRYGLGRAVIAGTPDSFDTPEWRAAVGFLWKVHRSQLKGLAEGASWREEWGLLPQGGSLPDQSMGTHPLRSAPYLYQALMPKSVRLVPLSWIAGLLVLFVLAIGPGDYLLLGLIRRRRLTWVLFPALSVGFTLGMVMMARYYLGTNTQHGALVFVDLGEGGRVLRTSRYELTFAAQETDSAVRYRDALASVLDPTQFAQARDYRAGTYITSYYQQSQLSEPQPPVYSGRLPGDYELRRHTQQWVPQLTRTLTIGGEGPDLGLHWDAVSVKDLEAGHDQRVLSALLAPSGFSGQVLLLHAKLQWRELRQAQLPTASGTSWERMAQILGAGTLPEEATARPTYGLFSLVSQVSPTGAGNFEDLSILDPSDPNQWVLIAVQKAGNDYTICRRLYFGGP